MKPYSVYLFRFAAVMVIVVMFMGCTHTITIRSADIPLLQTGSPLKGIKPKTFAFKEFRDIRGTDALWVGKIGDYEQKLDQPVAAVVAMAIRKELERNGHICIDYSLQSKADFIIEGTLYKYRLYFQRVTLFTSRFIGNVVVKLTISNTSPDKGVLIKSYQGESQIESGAGFATGGKPLVTLSQAQLAMVKEISTDSELIEFIEK